MNSTNSAPRSRQFSRRNLALSALVAATMLTPWQAAHAQAAAAEEASEVTDPSDIVVSARRRAERLIDVPVAAASVGQLEIRQYNITTLQNLTTAVPTISFDRAFTGAGSSISMRGVSSSSLDAGLEQSVLLLYDDMPISRGRILADAIFDIDGVDVLKGPQSLFFGKDSPGGVVSLRSANPTDTFQGFARVGYEVRTRQPMFEGAISGPLTDTLSARLALFGSESDGYLRNNAVGIQDPSRVAQLPRDTGGTFVPGAQRRLGAEDKYGARLTLKYAGDNFNAVFKLLGTYSRGQGQQSLTQVMSCPAGVARPRTQGQMDPTGDCKLDRNVSAGFLPPALVAAWPEARGWNTGGPSSRNISYLPNLSMTYDFGNVALTSVTSYYHYNYRSAGNADGSSFSFFWTYQKERNTSFVQELRLVSDFEGPLEFTAGGYFEDTKRTTRNGGLNGPTPRDPTTGKYNTFDNQGKNSTKAISGFGQLTYDITDQLELAGGGRYTHIKKTVDLRNLFINAALAANFLAPGLGITGSNSEENFSPEATLTYRASRDLMFYGAYKTGYLSGGFSKPGSINPTLNLAKITYGEERVKGFEAGTKFSLLDRKLSGSLIGYRYNYKGLQLSAFNVLVTPPVFQTSNAASTRVQGVELDLNYRPTQGLTFKGKLEYNSAKFGDYPNAQCFAGQTAAQGCNTVPGTTGRVQSLKGQQIYRAPKWIGVFGATYDFAVSDSLKLGLNADARRTTGYFTTANNVPLSWQKAFTIVNAGVRLGAISDSWTVSLIGRNLTNKYYATVATEKPGGAGEVMTVASEPRMVTIQLETKF